jgi:hypothetical protein
MRKYDAHAHFVHSLSKRIGWRSPASHGMARKLAAGPAAEASTRFALEAVLNPLQLPW